MRWHWGSLGRPKLCPVPTPPWVLDHIPGASDCPHLVNFSPAQFLAPSLWAHWQTRVSGWKRSDVAKATCPVSPCPVCYKPAAARFWSSLSVLTDISVSKGGSQREEAFRFSQSLPGVQVPSLFLSVPFLSHFFFLFTQLHGNLPYCFGCMRSSVSIQ